MPNMTIPGLNSITTPGSAGLLWISDPGASPQDRSFALSALRGWLTVVDAISGSKTYTVFQRDTRVIESAAGTVDITAGATLTGCRVEIVNKVAAGITLAVTTGAASVTMGIGSLAFEWDGTQWHKIGGMALVVVFTSGTGATWKTPWAGSYKLTAIGGGGGGGGCKTANATCGGGGGGGAGGAAILALSENAGVTLTYTIGAAGTAGAATPTDGGTGGSTTISDGTTTPTGNGGAGGVACNLLSANTVGGAGGAATNGQLNIKGGGGGAGNNLSTGASGDLSGAGGSSILGGGGPGRMIVASGVSAGVDGGPYGSGGSGGAASQANTVAGGAGYAGVIVIEF